ncbi:TrbC family F-type conjugative pilus assembly protein [Thorsellia anophelis]|uniref:Type-F conjugative transfer system pilin assembly protein n=1 Tax=Thorsellia anophelis DSM 18579 TaxID=1123402 RepID=A0A1I0D051_9GAMM|nr:TrbC family F-type conjugative pilus assembly protein [Thorsellia anophelis]SET25432.1 Type-F conjugative transfer system pilin assembly protein [Thorsellia anophelis DSM 18579]
MLHLCKYTKYSAQTVLKLIILHFLYILAQLQSSAKLPINPDNLTGQYDINKDLMSNSSMSIDSGIAIVNKVFDQQKRELGYWLSDSTPQVNNYSPTNLSDSLSFDMLVSAGMSNSLLTKIFEEAHHYQANIIVKGLLPNQTLMQTMAFWRQYAIKHTPPVNIFIDPTVFNALQARLVPMLIAKVNDKQIATVIGVYSVDWFMKKIKTKIEYFDQILMGNVSDQSWSINDSYDFGHHGPSMTIVESDLIEQMQYKLAQIDWEDKKKRAYENFWFNLPLKTLPPALTCQTHYIDPTIKLSEPLLNEKGEVLVSKGIVINPLSYLPFKQHLIIFNPTRSVEKERIHKYLNKIKSENIIQNQRVTLIATDLLPQTAWQMLKTTEDEFRMPVYRLTEAVEGRFNIMTTPTLIVQEGNQFKIQSGCL